MFVGHRPRLDLHGLPGRRVRPVPAPEVADAVHRALVLLAGVVPILIFWVERKVTQRVRASTRSWRFRQAQPAATARPASGDMSADAHGRTAFVLGGGGLLGAVEVGMLRALFEYDVKPDLIVGTSVGALNGLVVASDPHPDVVDRLLDLWRSVSDEQRRLQRQHLAPGHPGRAHRHPPALLEAAARASRAGVRGDHLRGARGAVPVLRGQHRAGRRDLVQRGTRWCRPWWRARRCPGLLPPARVGDEHYLDGGIVNSIPVGRAVELGATRVFVLQVGRIDRPLVDAAQAVGGRPGLLRDRSSAPVRARDGRPARRRDGARAAGGRLGCGRLAPRLSGHHRRWRAASRRRTTGAGPTSRSTSDARASSRWSCSGWWSRPC